MEEQKTLELEPVLEVSTGNYEVKNFEDNKKIVEDYITKVKSSVIEIHDDIAYKSAREQRTDVRKKKEAITKARIDSNALLLGKFNEQLNVIEEMLKGVYQELKAKIDAYKQEAGKGVIKPKVITLVVKGLDPKVIDEVMDFAKKKGLVAEIK